MPILSIAIQKGGSGKTTTTINLAAALQQLGKKVLVVDLDPQANMTQALGFSEDPDVSMYNLFRMEANGEAYDLQEVITEGSGLPILPATLELANTELELAPVFGRERILARILDQLPQEEYDWILLDCPPSLGLITVNALTASDLVLMPLQAEFLPMKGVESFLKTFTLVQKQLNPRLSLLGLVLTRYDKRTSLNKDMQITLRERYGENVFNAKIHINVALAKAQEWGADIYNYDKTSRGAFDYLQMAKEVLNRTEKRDIST